MTSPAHLFVTDALLQYRRRLKRKRKALWATLAQLADALPDEDVEWIDAIYTHVAEQKALHIPTTTAAVVANILNDMGIKPSKETTHGTQRRTRTTRVRLGRSQGQRRRGQGAAN